ncbi:predicted protein [Postia placenta Mad-698-R]|nr:predicted protein [Postia placenta Mad-698-R]
METESAHTQRAARSMLGCFSPALTPCQFRPRTAPHAVTSASPIALHFKGRSYEALGGCNEDVLPRVIRVSGRRQASLPAVRISIPNGGCVIPIGGIFGGYTDEQTPSDLVACGVMTFDETVELASVSHTGQSNIRGAPIWLLGSLRDRHAHNRMEGQDETARAPALPGDKRDDARKAIYHTLDVYLRAILRREKARDASVRAGQGAGRVCGWGSHGLSLHMAIRHDVARISRSPSGSETRSATVPRVALRARAKYIQRDRGAGSFLVHRTVAGRDAPGRASSGSMAVRLLIYTRGWGSRYGTGRRNKGEGKQDEEGEDVAEKHWA